MLRVILSLITVLAVGYVTLRFAARYIEDMILSDITDENEQALDHHRRHHHQDREF